MQNSEPAAERVYHISPFRRGIVVVAWLVCALLIAVPLAAIAWAKHDWRFFTIVSVVAAASMVIPFELAWVSRLVLTQEGIALSGFHGRKSRLATTWKNVAAIRANVRGAEGLIVKEPLEGPDAEWLARYCNIAFNGAPMYDTEKRRLMSERRFIPLEVFAHWMRHGDLWEQIRDHAPWLANAEGQPAAYQPRIQEKPWTRKNTITLTVVLAIVFAVVIGLELLPPQSHALVSMSYNALIGLSLGLAAFSNFVSALMHLRKKHYDATFLWFAMGIFQGLFALVIFGSLPGAGK